MDDKEIETEYHDKTVLKGSFGLRTVFSLCLLGSFFLPWFSGSVRGISGLEIPLISGSLMSGSAISIAGMLGGGSTSMYIAYVMYILPPIALYNIFLDVFKITISEKKVAIIENIRNGIMLLLMFLPMLTLFSGISFWLFFLLFLIGGVIVGWYLLKTKHYRELDLYIASEFLIGIFIVMYVFIFASRANIVAGFSVGYYATLLFSILGVWAEIRKGKKGWEEKVALAG